MSGFHVAQETISVSFFKRDRNGCLAWVGVIVVAMVEAM